MRQTYFSASRREGPAAMSVNSIASGEIAVTRYFDATRSPSLTISNCEGELRMAVLTPASSATPINLNGSSSGVGAVGTDGTGGAAAAAVAACVT